MALATGASGACLGVAAARVNLLKALQEPGVYNPIMLIKPFSLWLQKAFTLIVTAEASLWTLLVRWMRSQSEPGTWELWGCRVLLRLLLAAHRLSTKMLLLLLNTTREPERGNTIHSSSNLLVFFHFLPLGCKGAREMQFLFLHSGDTKGNTQRQIWKWDPESNNKHRNYSVSIKYVKIEN